MEDSGIDSDPKAVNHIEDERLFLVNIHLDKHVTDETLVFRLDLLKRGICNYQMIHNYKI